MKRLFKGGLWAVILTMLISLCGYVPISAEGEIEITSAAGWFESAYVTWTGSADKYNVYSKKSGGDYVKLDDELVRAYPGYFRADALGLAAGEYILRIVPIKNGEEAEGAAETQPLTVMPHVREGFGFSQNSPYLTSSGAYNDDGTLKEDADVIYVTNGNKDTVTINGDPSLGVGLTQILAYRQAKKIKTTLAIRIIGKVDEPADTVIHTAQFQNTGNVTLEGVGDDAVIFGWIMTLKRVTNMEVRNLAMMYGGEGTTGSAIVLDTDNKNVWVHNCDFFYGAPGKDADQKKGDGAVDLKSRSDYVTISYNHFWDLGKTCVSGGPWENSNMYSEEAQIFVTYHHNWFDHTDSRHPRCVVGSNHVYNNYYDGNAMYGIGAAMKTSVFSENNYYRNCPRPMIIASQGSDCYDAATDTYKDKGTLSGQMGGMIKSYGDVIVGADRFYPYGTEPVSGEFDAYVAASRDEVVPHTVTAKKGDEYGCGTYNNFDSNPEIMYEYQIDAPKEAVEKVKKYSGRVEGGDFKWSFNNETDDSFHDIDENLLAAIKGYQSSLVAVGGGIIPVEPAEPTASAQPTTDPNTTPAPTPRPAGDMEKIPVGAASYAKDWFGGESMSAGDLSADGYIYCCKGSGNSYKTNAFTTGGLSITRGYQTKAVDQRSYYCIPETECNVTVYFYSNGTNSLGLYTTSLTEPAATFQPEAAGDYAFTYHFTEVGSPLYIAGPKGDINFAGISVAAAKTPYEIENAEFNSGGELSVTLTCNTDPPAEALLIVAVYSDSEQDTLTDFKALPVNSGGTTVIDNVNSEGIIKVFVWSGTDSIVPYSNVEISD